MKTNTTCDNCGKPVYKKPSDMKRYKHKFCNLSCERVFFNRNKKSPKELIEEEDLKSDTDFDDELNLEE